MSRFARAGPARAIIVNRGFDSRLSTYTGFKGCIVTRSTDLTAQNITGGTTPKIGWDVTVRDDYGAHSSVTNNSRITIPAAWNGLYGIVSGCMKLTNYGPAGSNYLIPRLFKNGTNVWVWLFASQGDDAEQHLIHTIQSPLVQLVTNDFYEMVPQYGHGGVGDDTSVDIVAAQSCFAVFVIG